MQQVHKSPLLVHDLDVAEVESSPIVLVIVGRVSRFEDLILGDWYAIRHGDVEAVDMLWKGMMCVKREDLEMAFRFSRFSA